jgi:hypothetical protein
LIEALNQVAHNPGTPTSQYRINDKVWLEVTHLQLPYQISKLNPKRYRPFRIVKEVSPVTFWLELPPAWRIHDVFHASLLSPYQETPEHGPNFSWPPPDIVDGEVEQEIERILDHWQTSRRQCLQYLVKWKGFPKSNNKWVFHEHMHAPEAI